MDDLKPTQHADDLRQAMRDFEKEFIFRVLSEEPDISSAARRLGIGRTSLYRKLTRFELGVPQMEIARKTD